MTQPWVAEFEMTTDAACTVIEAQFPRLAPAVVERLGEGWDNTVFRVNGEYVFRFPRRQLGVECIKAELPILSLIAGELPLAIPRPLFVGQPSDAFHWPFAGYQLIRGRTACCARLNDEQRSKCAQPLALFLQALHSLELESIRSIAKLDEMGRLDLEKRVPQTHGQLDRIEEHQLVEHPQKLRDTTDRATHLTRQPRAAAIVHGDLYARHLIVDDDDRLAGVIDWGDVHFGDPAVDLGVVFMFLPPSSHDSFWQSYGTVDDATWQLARFRALQHQSVVVNYAHEIGDEDLLREAQMALRFVASA